MIGVDSISRFVIDTESNETYRLHYLEMDDAMRCRIQIVILQCGTHIMTLNYAGNIFSLAFLSNDQLASGNRDEPLFWEPISGSGRASSSYTDYNAFVMLDHVHFILYTPPDDRPKFYLDLNIDDFCSNILPGAYWMF